MASWEIECRNCHKKFTHSMISDELMNYYLPMRPAFPDEGSELECPHCSHKTRYQRNDLTFKA